jgi:ABC-type branched-subunit amino acid transport system ATPase component/branched-subunit amino acid ABC-type transport system permease component
VTGTLGFDLSSQVVFSGAVTGLTYGLMAVGVVLTFRSTRVINFAIGEMGGLAAALLYRSVIDWDVPFWLAFVAGIAIGALVGAALELLIVRRLFDAPRVILLVALIGAAQLLVFAQLILPMIENVRPYPTAVNCAWEIAGIVVRGSELVILIVLPILVTALAIFFRRSRYGLAIRASAANADAARLYGIRIKTMSTVVWVITGGLAATASMLFGPLSPSGQTSLGIGPGFLMRVLVAALIARMSSLPIALAGGVAIGIGEALVNYNFNDQRGVLDLVLFLVLLVALLVGGRHSALAETTAGRWSFSPRVRPVPAALAGRRWVRSLPGLGFVALVLAGLVPLVFLDLPSQQGAWTKVVLYAMVALSLTVLTGWSGQLSLGQFAFVGLGGMTTAVLVGNGLGFLPALVLAGFVSAATAILVGFPALRRPGPFLAITTFAFAVVTSSWLLWQDVFLDGATSAKLERQVLPLPAGLFRQGLDLDAAGSYYGLCFAALAIVLLATATLQRSRLGRSMVAVRDNEQAAASIGISPSWTKITSFAYGGWVAGFAGGLFLGLVTRAGPQDFPASESLRVISIVVIGGLTSVTGAVLGAFWVIGLPLLFGGTAEVSLLTSGAGLLILLLYFPGGFVHVLYTARDAAFAAIARRRPEPDAESTPTRPAVERLTLPRRPVPDGLDAVIRVQDLSVAFGGHVVVDSVALEVRPGEIVGLIGANGAGKSTLMNAIGGYVPCQGQVEILGIDASGLSPARRSKLGLGRCFQQAELFQDLTVRETVGLALPGVRPWQRVTRAEADEVIDFLGLGPFIDRFINELSTGTRRIVELACIVASDATVMCLDEPTAGIAQREAEAFGPLILRLRKELGASLLVIEHDMPVIMGISDRVYCLEVGQLLAEGTPQEVRDDPQVIASYLGTTQTAIQRSGDLVQDPTS